jgi:hypothetical protein
MILFRSNKYHLVNEAAHPFTGIKSEIVYPSFLSQKNSGCGLAMCPEIRVR